MERPPDFSEYGDKSLQHLIDVKCRKVADLHEQLERENAIFFYAIKEKIRRKHERENNGTVAG